MHIKISSNRTREKLMAPISRTKGWKTRELTVNMPLDQSNILLLLPKRMIVTAAKNIPTGQKSESSL